jgi:GAF domain-containing protein
MALQGNYLKTIGTISRAFGTAQNQNELLDLLVESAVSAMKAKAACLFLADTKYERFIPMAHKGLSERYLKAGLGSVDRIALVLKKKGYSYYRDATEDPRLEHHKVKKAEGIGSILIVPVMVKSVLVGILALYTANIREFTNEEIEFLAILAEQGGMAIENTRLIERIRNNTRMFLDVAANINASLDVKEILQALSVDIAHSFGVKAASIRLLDDDGKTLKLVASYGLSKKYLSKGPISAEKSIAEALNGKPVVVADASKDRGVQYRKEKEEEGIVSILCVPIKCQDAVIGVLRLYSEAAREFTDDEIQLVTALAYQGGLAIRNASMYLALQNDLKDMKEDAWSYRCWF